MTVVRTRMFLGGAAIAAVIVIVAVVFNAKGRSVEEAKILADLQKLSESEGQPSYLSNFELICFGIHEGAIKQELLQEAQRLGRSFPIAAQSCGVASNTSGTIALITGSAVRCVDIYWFDYWTEMNRPLCVAPTKLAVEPIAEAPPMMPGRPKFRSSRPSYQVTERAR